VNHSEPFGIAAADQYDLARRRHMEVIAAIRAIDEPETERVAHRLSRIIHHLTTAIGAELRPYIPATPEQLRQSRPQRWG
jgi:hypothetical protein